MISGALPIICQLVPKRHDNQSCELHLSYIQDLYREMILLCYAILARRLVLVCQITQVYEMKIVSL